jgi:hypothetical protein
MIWLVRRMSRESAEAEGTGEELVEQTRGAGAAQGEDLQEQGCYHFMRERLRLSLSERFSSEIFSWCRKKANRAGSPLSSARKVWLARMYTCNERIWHSKLRRSKASWFMAASDRAGTLRDRLVDQAQGLLRTDALS